LYYDSSSTEVAIIVGVYTAYKLIVKLDEISDATTGEFARKWWEVETTLRLQALNGQNVGEGIFY